MIKENSATAKALEKAGQVWRWIQTVVLVATAIGLGVLFWLVLSSDSVSARSVPTVVPQEPTHFDLEYNVNGTRYVRTMHTKTARLLEGVATDLGIHPSHLIAMCIQEASVPNGDKYYACDPTAVGDGGLAIGAFQIHRGYHSIKKEDAEHIYFSAVWTAERLLQKGYKRNTERAIRCHNSCNPNNGYGERVLQIARTLKPISQ